MYTAKRARIDYKYELDAAKEWKKDGQRTITSDTAGQKLAKGRTEVPIDEYISHLNTIIDKLRNLADDADAEEFNY